MNQPSLQQLFANRRGQSNVYGGPAPTARRRQAPPPRRPAGGQGSKFEQRLAEYHASGQDSQRGRGRATKAVQDVLGERSGLSKGLGTVFGGAANALGFMQRSVVAGIDELAESPFGRALGASGAGPSSTVMRTFNQNNDGRSFSDRVGDISYGFGDATVNSGNPWVDNAAGFAGDVVTDPLSYVTLGLANSSSIAGRTALAGRAEAQGMGEEAVRRLGKYGASHVDTATRQSLGEGTGAMRFAGVELRGTEKLGQAAGRATSRTREAIMDTTPGVWARRLRGDETVQVARRVLQSGKSEGGMTASGAAAVLRIHKGIEMGGGAVAKQGGNAARQILKGMSERDRIALTHAVQAPGMLPADGKAAMTRELLNDLRQTMEDSGIKVGDLGPTYFPQRLNDQGKEWFKAGSKEANEIIEKLSIDSLDQPSAIRTRFFKEGAEFELNGKPFVLKHGTIDEVNTIFTKELGFAPFETDAGKVISQYLAEVSRAVGINRSMKQFLASDSVHASTLGVVGRDVLDDFAVSTANEDAAKAVRAFVKVQEEKIASEAADISARVEDAKKLVLANAKRSIDALAEDKGVAQRGVKKAEKKLGDVEVELASVMKDVEARKNIQASQIAQQQRRLDDLQERISAAQAKEAADLERASAGYGPEVATAYRDDVAALVAERDVARKELDRVTAEGESLDAIAGDMQAQIDELAQWERVQQGGDQAIADLATSKRKPIVPKVKKVELEEVTATTRNEKHLKDVAQAVLDGDYKGAARRAAARLSDAQKAYDDALAAVEKSRPKGRVEGGRNWGGQAVARNAADIQAQQAARADLTDYAWNDALVQNSQQTLAEYQDTVIDAFNRLDNFDVDVLQPLYEAHRELFVLGMTPAQHRHLDAIKASGDARVALAAAQEADDVARDMARRMNASVADAQRAADEIDRIASHETYWRQISSEWVDGDAIPPAPVRTPDETAASLKVVRDNLKRLPREVRAVQDLTKAITTGAPVSEGEVRTAALHVDGLLSLRAEGKREVQRLKNERRKLTQGGTIRTKGGSAKGFDELEWDNGLGEASSVFREGAVDSGEAIAVTDDAIRAAERNMKEVEEMIDVILRDELGGGNVSREALRSSKATAQERVDSLTATVRNLKRRKNVPEGQLADAQEALAEWTVKLNDAKAAILNYNPSAQNMTIDRLARMLPGYGNQVDSGYKIMDTGEMIPIRAAAPGADSLETRLIDKYGTLDRLLEANPDIKPPTGFVDGSKNVKIGSLKPQQMATALGVTVKKVDMGFGDRMDAISSWLTPLMSDMPMRTRRRLHASSLDGATRHNDKVAALRRDLVKQEQTVLQARKEYSNAARQVSARINAAEKSSLRLGDELDLATGMQGQAEEAAGEALGAVQARLDDPVGRRGDAIASGQLEIEAKAAQERADLVAKRREGTAKLEGQQALYRETMADGRARVGSSAADRDAAAFDLADRQGRLDILDKGLSDLRTMVKAMKVKKEMKTKSGGVHIANVEKFVADAEKLTAAAKEAGGADGRALEVAAFELEQAAKQLAGLKARQDSVDVGQKILKVATDGKWVTTELADGTKVSPYWSKVVTDAWEAVDAKLVGGDGVISKEVADGLRGVIEAVSDESFWQHIDALTQFFKTYATATPGFHVRNAMSASFMNFSDGVGMSHHVEGREKWVEMIKAPDMDVWLQGQPKRVRDAADGVFGSGAGGQYSAAELGNKLVKGKLMDNPATRFSRKVGTDWAEGPLRMALALHEIDRGGDAFSAAARVTRLQFNYSEVSKFDRKMKRLIPFWTFMSRNLPLQIQQMWTKPRAYSVYQNFVENFDIAEDGEITPKWLKEIGGFTVARETPILGGRDMVLAPDLPQTRLQSELGGWAEDPKSFFQSATPYLRVPYELAHNESLFYGGKIYDEDDDLLERLKTMGSYALDNSVPPVAQAQRLMGLDDDAGKAVERRANYVGIPVRGVGDQERANELRRRAFAQG